MAVEPANGAPDVAVGGGEDVREGSAARTGVPTAQPSRQDTAEVAVGCRPQVGEGKGRRLRPDSVPHAAVGTCLRNALAKLSSSMFMRKPIVDKPSASGCRYGTPRSVMKLLLDPFANQSCLVHATRRRDLSDGGPFVAAERNRHAASRARKHGLGDLFELVVEPRHLVSLPELSKLTNGIRIGDLHGFFQRE